MKGTRKRNAIIFVAALVIIFGFTTTVYNSYGKEIEKEVKLKVIAEEKKPFLPVDEEKEMFGRKYMLVGKTAGGAGIYADRLNDRTRDHVTEALDEAGIDNTMNDLDKVKAINDYLCDKLSYADYAAEEGFSYKEYWVPFTDYCLLTGQAVCAGYADAFQSMAITCGIECFYVTGHFYQKEEDKRIYHAWNRIVINGEGYYIDVCGNDKTDNAYFLSANGWESHEIDKEEEVYKISGQFYPMPEW